VITFNRLKWASFTHSTIYAALLASWAAGWQLGETIFGFGHGIGWFVMCGLAYLGLRRRVIPLYIAVCVAIIGAIGPFVGTAAFIREDRLHRGGRVKPSWQ
jgi:hypothetical protein